MEDDGGSRRWLVLASVLLGQFMVVGSVGSMVIALPSIGKDLDASASALQWVLVLYQLGFAVVLVTGGRLGDLFGRRRMFLLGLAGFVAMSTLGGLAPSIGLLIAARLFQGIAGGITGPQVLAMIQVTFPPEERPKAFAAFGMVNGSSFMIGQLMSGALIKLDVFGLGWRAAILVNLVLGLIALTISSRVLPTVAPTGSQRLDLAGVALASAGGLFVLYPLIQGRSAGWPPIFFLLLAVAVPVIVAFIRFERGLADRGGSPLIDPRLFHSRSFPAGLAVAVAFAFSTFPTFYVLTLTLQRGYGFDPLKSALTTAPVPVTVICMSFLVSRLLPRLGRRLVAIAATFGMLASMAIIATLQLGPQPMRPYYLIPALVLLGCNNGLGMTSIINLTLADVPDEHAGAASGLLQTAQQAMSAVGVAFSGIIFFGVLESRTSVEAYVDALSATLLLTMTFCLLVIILSFRLPPHVRLEEPEMVEVTAIFEATV